MPSDRSEPGDSESVAVEPYISDPESAEEMVGPAISAVAAMAVKNVTSSNEL